MTFIPGLSLGGAAIGINDAGQVVGWMIVQDPATGRPVDHPFLSSGGKLTDLGLLPGATSASAFDINNASEVVGGAYGGIQGHAFLSSGGKLTDLGTLGGLTSDATYINNSGQIVGYSDTSLGTRDFFLYQDEKMTDLKDLIRATGGMTIADVAGINDRGQIAIGAVIDGKSGSYLLTPEAVPEPTTVAFFAVVATGLLTRRFRRQLALSQR